MRRAKRSGNREPCLQIVATLYNHRRSAAVARDQGTEESSPTRSAVPSGTFRLSRSSPPEFPRGSQHHSRENQVAMPRPRYAFIPSDSREPLPRCVT
jgi:hypothetical protein